MWGVTYMRWCLRDVSSFAAAGAFSGSTVNTAIGRRSRTSIWAVVFLAIFIAWSNNWIFTLFIVYFTLSVFATNRLFNFCYVLSVILVSGTNGTGRWLSCNATAKPKMDTVRTRNTKMPRWNCNFRAIIIDTVKTRTTKVAVALQYLCHVRWHPTRSDHPCHHFRFVLAELSILIRICKVRKSRGTVQCESKFVWHKKILTTITSRHSTGGPHESRLPRYAPSCEFMTEMSGYMR